MQPPTRQDPTPPSGESMAAERQQRVYKSTVLDYAVVLLTSVLVSLGVALFLSFFGLFGRSALALLLPPLSGGVVTALVIAWRLSNFSLESRASSGASSVDNWYKGEAKFQATFHATPDPIMVVKLHEGSVLDVNESLQRLLARERNELVGESLDHLLQWRGDAQRGFMAILEREGSVSNLAATMHSAEGSMHHVLVSARYVQLDGEPCAIAIARDISDHYRLQEELATKASLLENVLSHIPHFVFWKDKDGKYLGANEAYAHNMFGAAIQDVIGATDSELGRSGPYAQISARDHGEVLASGQPIINAERTLILHDKRTIIGLVSKVPLLDQSGTPQGVLGITADITSLRTYERQLRTLLDGLPDMAWIKNADSVYLAANQAFAQFHNLDPLDIPGRTDSDLWLADVATAERINDAKAISSLAELRYDQELLGTYAPPLWAEIIKRPITEYNMEGTSIATGTVSIARDISQQRAQESRIRMLSEALEQSSVAVAVTDSQGMTVHLNPRYEELTGYSLEELAGKPLPLLAGSKRASPIWNALAAGKRWRSETKTARKDGTEHWLSVSIAPVVNNCGQTTNIVLVLEDISEQKRTEEHIRHLAMHDGLTGLANRRLFMDRLRHSVALNKRNSVRFAVLFIDLNDFKQINDTLGHDAGDFVLCTIAERLQESLRAVDTCARIGGDEFVALLHDIKNDDELTQASERVAKAITMPIDIQGSVRIISGAIGIAICPDDAVNVDQLIQHADNAMYRCKRNRKYDKAIL